MNDVIYIDFSTLSTFKSCKEKARLRYSEDLVPLIGEPPLEFGGAFHSAIQAFYIEMAVNSLKLDPPSLRELATGKAKSAFLDHLRERNSSLPTNIESDQKRSIERGLYLLEAYFHKWRNETLVNELRPDTGEPYVEIGFSLYLMEWKSRPVMYIGRLDRIMRSRVDNRLRIVETKTTSQGLTQFVTGVRPNHQITGYHWAARELLHIDVAGTIWDCIFISSRQPKLSGDSWETRGIDIEKDFNRSETRRTQTDVEEFLRDLVDDTEEYLTWKDSDRKRWPRTAPGACHSYGGCTYRDVCITNANTQIIENKFRREKWEPFKVNILSQK